MKTKATFFQNSKEKPLVYGEINLINPCRQRLRGEKALEGIEAYPVFCGFCGTKIMAACPVCGEKAEEKQKFCGKCGTKLF